MLSEFKFAACGKENAIYYMEWSLSKQKENAKALVFKANFTVMKICPCSSDLKMFFY